MPPSWWLLYFWRYATPSIETWIPTTIPNDDDVPPPAGGSQGSLAFPHGGDPAGRSSQRQASDASSIILCVSPASGSARFGYIYVGSNERHLQDTLMAYFDTSGHDVVVS